MTQHTPELILDTSALELIALWPHDNGHVAGSISMEGHTMTLHPWWADCGATGEGVSCSCGFTSDEASGHGCWQHEHDGGPEEHNFDTLHRIMHTAAHVWERAQDWLE